MPNKLFQSSGGLGDDQMNALLIGAGTVDNTEFGYLDGVTSGLQGQLNAKQPLDADLTALAGIGTAVLGDVIGSNAAAAWARIAGVTTTTRKFLRSVGDGAGAPTIPAWDTIAAGDLPSGIDATKIGGGGVTSAEFDYLDGVTSALQTQLDNKQPLDADLTALAGLGTAVLGDVIGASAATTWARIAGVTTTTRKFLRSVGDGADGPTIPAWDTIAAGDIPSGIDASKVGGGGVTSTEFDYLDGVTSALQTQIDGKQPLDADLTALAALASTAGMLARTGSDAFAVRTLLGTSNNLVISNADGASAAPTFSAVKDIIIQVLDGATNMAVADGTAYFTVPASANGMNLTAVHARVVTAGTTSTCTIQIANVTDSVDMLSTKISVDSAETGSETAATPPVINTSYDDVATNDLLRIDVDTIHTTPAKGLIITLQFKLP